MVFGFRPDRTLEEVLLVARRAVIRPVVVRFPRWVTPNSLSFLRLMLGVIVAALIFTRYYSAAAVLYVIGALSDAFDGELARVRQLTSVFGARLDPTVDKIFHGMIFYAFLPREPFLLGALLTADVLLLVFGVTLLTSRHRALEHVSPSVFGRWKMLFQALGALLLLLEALTGGGTAYSRFLRATLVTALFFALCSMVTYTARFFDAKGPFSTRGR